MSEYVYRFTEVVFGPYELRGDAISIYRAAILIGHGRPKIQGHVLKADGTPVDHDQFFAEAQKLLGLPLPDEQTPACERKENATD